MEHLRIGRILRGRVLHQQNSTSLAVWGPMTELSQRMLDAMMQRGFAASTQDIYVSAIRQIAKH